MIEDKLKVLPSEPGCYLYYNDNREIIYVGKAKDLKKRVKSYFNRALDGKTQMLVGEIHDMEFIITNSELESLILEINLIKKYDPKYNIMFTDDKTYPYIKLTNEKHPRLLYSREYKKNKDTYFGPYPDGRAARETLSLLNQLYPLRKCKTIPKKECLYYHIKQCKAPCIYEVTDVDYESVIKDIKKFFNSNDKTLVKELENKMLNASENLLFEQALEYKKMIEYITSIKEKHTMEIQDFIDRDFFGYYINNGWIAIQVFFMRQGKIIEHDVNAFPIIDDGISEFETFIASYYEKHKKPREIIVPNTLNYDLLSQLLEVKVISPTRGKKKKLHELASKNAKETLENKFYIVSRKEERTFGAISELGNLLGINPPRRIECFDNSHIQGVNPVSAMVVFINGKPAKKEYRKYKIKTVDGPNDIASMKEVVYRRYFKVLMEDLERPDLLLVDGGVAQVNATREVLKSLNLDIKVCGLSKDDKHRTSELLADEPIRKVDIDKKSSLFYLLTRIQDEVHRFAITFHRDLRSKSSIASTLENIEGVGKSRVKKLLKHFKSLSKIKEATNEELSVVVPKNVANNIYNTFNQNEI